MTYKILHLSTDDKFVDMGVDSFNQIEGIVNNVVVFSKGEIKHVKSRILLKVSLVSMLSLNLHREIRSHDIIVVHSLNPVWFRFLKCYISSKKVIWLGWGYDYYDLIPDNNLMEETSKFFLEKKTLANIKSSLKRYVYGSYLKSEIIKGIDIFAPVLPQESSLLLNTCGELFCNIEFSSWNYGSLEKNYIKNLKGFEVSGDSILLGNSATITNNHIEAIKLLGENEYVKDRLVLMPLSYGDFSYRHKLVSYLESSALNLEVINDFMDYDIYLSKIKSCGYVVMNHIRQQAVSNVVTMMYLGSKLFLNGKSPLYQFLVEEGAIVFNMDELANDPMLICKPLTSSEREKNRIILERHWSEASILTKTQTLIDKVILDA